MNLSSNLAMKATIYFFIILILTNQVYLPTGSSHQNIVETITQDPIDSMISEGENVSIGLTVYSGYNIDNIYFLYCQLSPSFLCHYPGIIMNTTDNINYNTWFIPEYSIGATLGYHFVINLANGTCTEFPTYSDTSRYSNIQEGEDGTLYFTLNITNDASTPPKTSNTSPAFNSDILIPVCLFTLIIFIKREDKY
ncbi:MAG: hypothetical protein ACTSR2_14140 [Candidatus Hodarchaeales archaeon]